MKHLECGGDTEEHLEKRRFYSGALTVQTGTSYGERGRAVQKKADHAADDAQGAETKRRAGPGRCRERGRPPAPAPHHAGSHN